MRLHSCVRSLAVAVAVLASVGRLPNHAAAQVGSSTSQVVALAPAVSLINDIEDVDAAGNCVNEIKQFCSEIKPGKGRLAYCLSDQVAASESPDSADGTGSVSDACREDVFQFKIERSTNINLNVPLAKACKVDAERFCNVSWMFGHKTGQVIACLRVIKAKLAPACQKLVFQVQMDAAEDYRADPQLYEACKEDAGKLCKDVKLGGGRVQACLRDNRSSLSMRCEEQLFRQESENADDARLSVRLFARCAADKRKFCADVAPGAAKVKDCLEENRNEKDFSAACKEEVDAMVERRARNFRIDSRLRSACADDIFAMCGLLRDQNEADSNAVVRCLQDYVEELKNPACKQQVYKYKQLAAEDVRFDVPLADACYQDRQSYCANVPPGSARVFRCLVSMRAKLSTKCRAVLFDEEVRFSQNIDFQFSMKKACVVEIKMFCKDIPHGEARVIRCLQEHKTQKDFGKQCREEVKVYETEAASDYRLNHRLAKSCKADIDRLCALVCKANEGQVCGGAVLHCLRDKHEELTTKACKQEVLYMEKMEVTDYRNDVILAAACRVDVENFCNKVEPGESRVHQCLRSHQSQLSDECRKEELALEELEAENIELRPGIMRVCRDERRTFCKGVVPGGARMFRCLAEKMADADFGKQCAVEIIEKLRRRQANWKLDPPLRKACKADVKDLCVDVERKNQEQGLVYKCLVANFNSLDVACQKEVGRAMHMAFFIWSPGMPLTQACDDNIQQLCLARRPNMGSTPGAVGTCVATILEEMADAPSQPADQQQQQQPVGSSPRAPRVLIEQCRVLADIAQPPDVKRAFEASLSIISLQQQLAVVEGVTGLQMFNRDRYGNLQSLTLTGGTALAGVVALTILIIWSFMYAWRQCHGVPTNKAGPFVVKRRHG